MEVDRPVRTYHCVFEMFLEKRRIELSVNILIASADRIRLSADALIVFLNAIRKNMSGEGFALSYKLFFSGGEGYNIFSNAKRSVFSVVPR